MTLRNLRRTSSVARGGHSVATSLQAHDIFYSVYDGGAYKAYRRSERYVNYDLALYICSLSALGFVPDGTKQAFIILGENIRALLASVEPSGANSVNNRDVNGRRAWCRWRRL